MKDADWYQNLMMATSDWLLPDTDCVLELVLPLALAHVDNVGACGGDTGSMPAIIYT